MNARNMIVAGVASLAAVGSWLLLWRQPPPAEDTEAAQLTGGYYLTGATITASDEAGAFLYTLQAERIDQHPGDGSVALTHLRLEYAADRDIPWVITAAGGSMPTAGDRIDLEGDIEITGRPSAEHGALAVTTETLTVLPLQRTATTADPVRVVQGDSVLTATGMAADFAAQRLTLRADIRGVFGGAEE